MNVNSSPLQALGGKIRAARIDQRYDVKAAASAAGIARDTWKKIENGESVHDTKRAAALQLLGLDWDGEPVGPPAQDAGYVASPGERKPAGVSDEEVLREIRAMRDDVRELSERVARIEQQGS